MDKNCNILEDHKHKYWIDCFKLVACFLVFWGRFFEVFIYENDSFLNYEGFVRIVMKSVLNGNFWVAVFCVISGYCISSRKINNAYDLIRYYIKRYLRFVYPLFLTLLFVIILGIVIRYRTYEFTVLLRGTWGRYYTLADFSFVEYLKFVFLFNELLDGPIWMIRPLFLSNCLLVTISYFVQNLYGKKKEIIWIFIAFISLVCFGAFNKFLPTSIIKYFYVFVSCLCGFCLKEIHNTVKRVLDCNKTTFQFVVILVFILLAFQDKIIFSLPTSFSGLFIIRLYSLWNVMYGVTLFLGVSSIAIDRDIKNTVIMKASKLSLPVYLLHWPVICSVGPAILLNLRIDLCKLSILILFVIINIFVVILSVLYELVYSLLLQLSMKIEKVKKSYH